MRVTTSKLTTVTLTVTGEELLMIEHALAEATALSVSDLSQRSNNALRCLRDAFNQPVGQTEVRVD